MNVLFIGGDNRYITIIEDFIEKNYNIDLLGYSKIKFNKNVRKINKLEIKRYDLIILPISGIDDEFNIKSMDGTIKIDEFIFKKIVNTVVLTGIITDSIKDIKNITSFFEDEEVKRINNNITVKGIVENIENKPKKNICILGYGNIGKELYENLKEKDINIMIGVIDTNDFNQLKENAFYTNNIEQFKDILNNSDVIINTVPENILDDYLVKDIQGYILDIASYPHGISSEIVEKYNLNYNLYLGIPSKFDPINSGKILLKKINEKIG